MLASEDNERLTVSFSIDGQQWGLKNVREYEWDFSNPMVHQMEAPELRISATHFDENDPAEDLFSAEPSPLVPRKWFLLDADIPRVKCPLWYKFQYFNSDKLIQELITRPPEDPEHHNVSMDQSISSLSWYNFGLQYVETIALEKNDYININIPDTTVLTT